MTYLTKDKEKFTKYRWEFMRRNPEYQRDWNLLRQRLPGVERNTGEDEPTREEAAFSDAWGIGQIRGYTQLLFDPGKDFDDLLEELPFENPVARQMIKHDVLFPQSRYHQPLTDVPLDESTRYETSVEKNFREAASISKGGILTIQVDLNFSEKRLKDDFEKMLKIKKKMFEAQQIAFATIDFLKSKDPDFFDLEIDFEDPLRAMQELIAEKGCFDEYKQFVEAELAGAEDYKIKPHHYDNFDFYLKAYDLKRQGKGWAETADLLGVKDPDKQRRIDTARNAYKSASKIIEMGIEPYIDEESKHPLVK